MEKTDQLVIVGAGEMGEIAYEYFTHDSPYEVVAFSVESKYIDADNPTLYDLPIVPLEELEERYPASQYRAFVAVTYTHFNRARERLFKDIKRRGYDVVSYVSSRAFVWHNATIGENCFIFENNVIQHMVQVEDNCVLWSGNHVGHRTTIRANAFISSHVVISGYCEIGSYTFMGVNSSVRDYCKVAQDNIVGAGTVITRDTEPGSVYVGNPGKATAKSAFETWPVPEEQAAS